MQGDNLNSSSNPQKSEFQNKGEEKSDKVKKNIPKVLMSNGIAVVIRAKIETIKGQGGKVKGIRKNLLGERNRKREIVALRVSPREKYSF